MSLKFKDEIDSTTFDNLTKEDANVAFELSRLASNIKHEFVRILDFLGPSLRNMKRKKTIICFFKCWILGLRPIVLLPRLLVMNKVRPLLKNMIEKLFPYVFKMSLSFASFG
jgi:hypothetical protein